MNCREFLTRHCDWVDGDLPSAEAASFGAHVKTCASCARYDRVVRRGTDLVREILPRVEASADLEDRVRHRLFHVRDRERRRASTAAVYAAAATVVMLGSGAAFLILASSPVPEVDAQVVWASAPARATGYQADPAPEPAAVTPLHAKALAVVSTETTTLAPLAAQPPAVATIAAEADGHDPHVPSAAGWPVYSRGAVATAFPGAHTSLVVQPADFRNASGRANAGPLLIRH